jgi:hypothetical protein
VREGFEPRFDRRIFAIVLFQGIADTFRVHDLISGSGRDITIQASSSEARKTVIEMIPGSVVTGVHRVRK